MAKAILLETRTSSFMDLIGNGKMYRVPSYQRDYSWTEEQWEDLWNDIMEIRPDPQQRHYMGALVIEAINDLEFQIIDGQQRMATLSLLALAVIKRLHELAEQGIDREANQERAIRLRSRFIGEKDPSSLVESSKLVLNATDNGFYQDYLVQLRSHPNPRGLPKSNRLLLQCFEYFLDRMKQDSSLATDGRALASLLNDTVARQLLFIIILVDNEINAYTIFETLNARGLELSATDLIKNYLFSRIQTKSDLDALQRRWQHLIATVRQERFPEFLRYHLLCEYRQVRRQRLFKIVRERVRTPPDVFNLMEALEKRAELFAALQDPTHEYWIERRECQPFIRELTLFGTRQLTPLLFAAWERFAPEDFARVLKLVSRVIFRYTVVSSLNPNALEPASHESAKAVLEGTACTPAEVFAKLQPVYVQDDKFRQDFSMLTVATSGRRKKIAKYILCHLESDRSGRACDHETDPATIEHVLPENPDERWAEAFPEEKWDQYVYRLGNLTLLEAPLNRRCGNAAYEEKLSYYAQSQYLLTQEIPKMAPEQWTPALVEKRQWQMAERAVHIWRPDFD